MNRNTSSHLFVGTSTNVSCKVHPVVLFSILDHHVRRHADEEYALGTLLGSVVDDGCVEVQDSFPVPFNVHGEDVVVDHKAHCAMLDLYKNVNPNIRVVGWYMTGSQVNTTSLLYHTFYRDLVSEEVPQPVHLLVDTSLKSGQMGIKAYVSSPLDVSAQEDEQEIVHQFQQISLSYENTPEERVGLDTLMRVRGQGAASGERQDSFAMLNDLSTLKIAVNRLTEMLKNVSSYVDKVVSGEVKGDVAVGRFLADTVALVPMLNEPNADKHFNASIQDLLMVMYLSNLTRTQLALAEKLHTVV